MAVTSQQEMKLQQEAKLQQEVISPQDVTMQQKVMEVVASEVTVQQEMAPPLSPPPEIAVTTEFTSPMRPEKVKFDNDQEDSPLHSTPVSDTLCLVY